jgi:hypothetical protein
MEPRLASFVAAAACVPAFFFLVYRSIAPYESAMPGNRLGGAMFYPGIAGFALGVAHGSADAGIIGAGYGGLAFLFLYPVIESYMLIVVFNRRFFAGQAATPLFFAMGGGALALGISFVEVFRSVAGPASTWGDAPLAGAMVVLATAFVLFHASKGLLLGTYFAEGSKVRGVIWSVLLEAPFGALTLTAHFPGVDAAPIVAMMAGYAAVLYLFTWNVFFRRRMPDDLKKSLSQERKRARRVALAREQK